MRKRGGVETGQATVEFALVLPFVLVVALAVAQLGVVVHANVMVAHAAREATRAGAADPNADLAAVAQRAAAFDPARLLVASDSSPGPGSGELITVTVRYRVPIRVPLIGSIAEPVVSASATMLVEG